MTTAVERIAGWASELVLDDVPDEVVDLCRAQRRSVLGAIAASGADDATGRVLDAVAGWAAPGPAPLVGRDRSVSVADALFAAAAASVALDFDDYLSFGHTGHSAVLAPLLLAAETGAGATDQLAAQVVANEVAGRLGGACLVGPLNGQLWSPIHAAGTALAAGRLLGLDAGRLAHALALSLWHAPRPTVPGFMAPDSKLLVAAEPAVVGLRAARLAAAGVTGPLDVLDHPQGFLGAFAFTPLPALLEGLGTGWATRTLCVKPYPGCAYIDTAIDGVGELGPIDAGDVSAVDVDASLLTCTMDGLSARYATAGAPTPVTISFSLRWSVAVRLLGGRLTPAEIETGRLAADQRDLAALAARVRLRHDWSLTLRTAEAMAPLLPVRSLLGSASRRRLLRGLRAVRETHESLDVGAADAVALVRALAGAGPSGLRDALDGRSFWDDEALASFRMAFPARVTVRLADGSERSVEVDVPRGGAGHATDGPIEVSRAKLAAWAPRQWGEEGAARIAKAIDADDDALVELLG